MKSKLNLIALSLLLATSTLSSVSFASKDLIEESSSKSSSLTKRIGYTVLESMAVGATVGAITHGVNGMQDSDADCYRAKILLVGTALANTPGSIPSDFTSVESIRSLVKIGIKTAFTAGGMYLGASYYQGLQALNGDVEPDENERNLYTSGGAALGNFTGTIVVGTLETTGSVLNWGVKKLFGGFFGSKSAPVSEVALVEEEDNTETLRLQQVAREEDERLALEEKARLALEEERRAQAEKEQTVSSLNDIFSDGDSAFDIFTQQNTEVQDHLRVAAEEQAKKLIVHPLEVQWNGVLAKDAEKSQERTAEFKVTKKDSYITGSETHTNASSSNSEGN